MTEREERHGLVRGWFGDGGANAFVDDAARRRMTVWNFMMIYLLREKTMAMQVWAMMTIAVWEERVEEDK